MGNQFVHAAGASIAVSGRLIRIGRVDGENCRFLDDPDPVVHALRTSPGRPDLFTFIQKLPATSPRYAYPMEWDNLAALQLSTFDEWWTKQLGFKARNKARQAGRRGVTLREVPCDAALVRGVSAIYDESPVRQGKPFRHYRKPVDVVERELGTFQDSSVFIGAFLEDVLIGFVKLTFDNSHTQAGLMHIVSMIGHRDKAPTNALIAQAVRSCTSRGIPYLVYANFAYGKKQRDGLSDFKERNGFRRVEVPRYFVPLTRKGALVLRLGLHHRATHYLPARWLDRARSLRNAWYARRLPGSASAP